MQKRLLLAALTMVIAAWGCGDDDSTTDPIVHAVANLTVSPSEGTVVTDFVFDAGGSTPAEALQYRWDWNSDGAWDTGWLDEATATARFAEGDTITVTLAVSTGEEADTTTVQVLLDDRHGEILESFPVPDGIDHSTCLAFDGSHLWLADWGAPGTGRIFEIDPASGDTVSSIHSPNLWPNGLEWVDGYLYVADLISGPKIFKQDPVTGEVVDQFEVIYSAHAGGLAWDGESFFYGSIVGSLGGDDRIHRYAPDGSHLSDIPCPLPGSSPRGLAHDGVHLWVTVRSVDSLFVVDPDDGSVIRSLYVSHDPTDLTFDGSHIWILRTDIGREISRMVP